MITFRQKTASTSLILPVAIESIKLIWANRTSRLTFSLTWYLPSDFFSKYFTSINPDSEGKVGVQGVIIYGLILTILFMVIKKLF